MAVALGVIALTACQSFTGPLPPQPQPLPPTEPRPEEPPVPQPVPEPPAPVQPPPKRFRLSAASSALVAQAQKQAKGGETVAATATLERALRIEPDNPLLWLELGRLRLNERNPAQAHSMGRKALALATGDTRAQAAAWRLIASALKAQGRNQEASEAEARASTLAVPLSDETGVVPSPMRRIDDEPLWSA
jgi:predicted Zn-dependent protease